MQPSRVQRVVLVLGIAVVLPGCTEERLAVQDSLLADASQRLAQVDGSLSVAGLQDEVRVVRDHWGIPHIYASNADDLFFAQGFIQAQDRLFQMDLWRRSGQGRFAEILGPDYIERDRLARLLRYRGDMEAEWRSYAPDARQLITQFVQGINAWVTIAKENPPIEFTLAGFEPEVWSPEDLLSREEAFFASTNATREVFRAQLVSAVGAERAALLLPPDPPTSVPVPLEPDDLALFDEDVASVLNRVGASARFGQVASESTRAEDQLRRLLQGSNNWVVSGARSVTGRPLLANDPHRALDHPSLRYVVHLNAPGWNVIGAVKPWLPGVATGHNERIAWGFTFAGIDRQDLYLEEIHPEDPRKYRFRGEWRDMTVETEAVRVRGRTEPVQVELAYTHHGPVIFTDPERQRAVAVRWTGAEAGTAAYMAALSVDRAQNWSEFRDALKRWKMPAHNMVYADVDGNIGYQIAGLLGIRRNWPGLLPVPGWSGEYEWDGWYTLDDFVHEYNPASGFLATANNNPLMPNEERVIGYEWADSSRISRIREVLASGEQFSLEDFQALQHDALSWYARQLVPLLESLELRDPELAAGRELLLDWDGTVLPDSAAAALYVSWERALPDQVAEVALAGALDMALSSQYARRASTALLGAVIQPTAFWFGEDPEAGRNATLVEALKVAVEEFRERLGPDLHAWRWGRVHAALFRHPLATDGATRSLLNIGPFQRGGYGLTVFATGGTWPEQSSGATYRHIVDLADWDRSVATNAPGQSGQPGSPHFDDLAQLWAKQEYLPLSFSDAAVEASAENTLTLTPQ